MKNSTQGRRFRGVPARTDEALAYSDGAQGGQPPFDSAMFKVLVIQGANNLSDERAEFLINDRVSFMRFLGPSIGLES
jgi:hypothetical protein